MIKNKEKNQRFFSPSIFPKSKKGDISTLILVIGVFLVCAIAIFSFAFFSSSADERFNVLSSMAGLNSIREQIRFYENIGANPEDYLGIKKESNGYLVTTEKKQGGERMFYIEYRISLEVSSSQSLQ